MLFFVILVSSHNPSPWAYFTVFSSLSLIEPILVSVTGGSIGHHLFGMQVIDQSSRNKIGIFRAIFRTVIRFIFGIFSLFFIHTTKRYQALHDLATKSLVVINTASSLSTSHTRDERTLEEPLYQYPSLWRRGLVISLYSVIAFTFITLGIIYLAETCLLENRCSSQDSLIVNLASIAQLVAIVVLMTFGVKGRLLGARRKKIVSAKAHTD